MGNKECSCNCGDNCRAEDDMLICRCEEVYLSEIKEAIAEGVDSFAELRRVTRAGMGLCQGRTCGRLARSIFAKEKGIPISEVDPATVRAPVKPIPMDLIGGGTKMEEFQDPEDETGREAPVYANQIFEDAYGGDGPVVL